MKRCCSGVRIMKAAERAKVNAVTLLCAAILFFVCSAITCPAQAHAVNEPADNAGLSIETGAYVPYAYNRVVQDSAESRAIAITDSNISVVADETATVYLTGQSANAIKWESSDSQIVVIDTSTTRKAVIKGVGKGTATIIATDEDGNSATCSVHVALPEFSITESMKLVVEDLGCINVETGRAASWKSSNNDILSITESEFYHADIKAEGVGTVTVTAVDKYGTESRCTVIIRQQEFEIYASPSCSDVYYDDGYGSYNREAIFSYYNHYNEYGYYESLDYYEVGVAAGQISSCISANSKVVSVVGEYGSFYIYPKGVGTTTVTAVDPYGEKETITCTVELNYFTDRETEYANYDELEIVKEYRYKNLKYGSGSLQGVTFSKAKITAVIKGKTYGATAKGNGTYSIKVPKYIKINTPITIRASQYGATRIYTRHVVSNKPKISLSSVRKSSKVVTLKLKDVHKGDYIKLTIGKKSYKKKVVKDLAKVTYKIKTKKQKKGQKVIATVYNKFKQKLSAKTKKVK